LWVPHTDSCTEELPSSFQQTRFLALKWAITEQFRDYLYYAPHFTVYTDNNLLTYVLTSNRRNATGYRWVAELSDFIFTVKYRPGTANRDVHSLSRMTFEQYISEPKEEVQPEWIKATVEAMNAQCQREAVWLAALSSRPRGVRRMMRLYCRYNLLALLVAERGPCHQESD